jgi:hypothetical protein
MDRGVRTHSICPAGKGGIYFRIVIARFWKPLGVGDPLDAARKDNPRGFHFSIVRSFREYYLGALPVESFHVIRVPEIPKIDAGSTMVMCLLGLPAENTIKFSFY